MSDEEQSGAARRVYKGSSRDKLLPLLGIRIPRVRLSGIGSGIALPSPPRMLMLMASYILLFWLMAGGIYFIVRNPIAVGSSGSGENARAVFFYPSTNESFIIEGIIAAILLFTSGIGLVLMYQGSLQKMNRSYAIKLLVVGFILSIIAFLALQWIMNIKLGKA
ncbi:MAG: hypothetical protein Q6373_001460 [Candidatus Sigynarchaeota archaeon]